MPQKGKIWVKKKLHTTQKGFFNRFNLFFNSEVTCQLHLYMNGTLFGYFVLTAGNMIRIPMTMKGAETPVDLVAKCSRRNVCSYAIDNLINEEL